MYDLLQEFSDANPEKFNEDLIYLKAKDNVLTHITSIFQALEVIKGVKFLGCSLNEDEHTFPDYIKNDKHLVNINEGRYVLINYKFELSDETGATDIIEKFLLFPKLIDKTYFILNGSKFFPIFQIIDSGTYNNSNSVTLKTLLMGLTVRLKEIKSSEPFYDIDDNEYSGYIKIVDLFRSKLNYFIYYFANRGVNKTLEYFLGKNYDDYIAIDNDIENIDLKETKKSCNIFQIHKDGTHLFISKKLFAKDRTFCLNLIDIFNGCSYNEIYSKDFWLLKLGSVFTRNKNNYENKANDILISFKRILDNSTKNTLRLKDENKEDIYAILRWIIRDFDILRQRNNMSLSYSRIRVYEYLLYDLLIKMSNISYRLLNKQEITLKDKQQLFSTLSPMFICKKIGTNELLRYYGAANSIELFNPCLKASKRGFQGLGEGSKDVSKAYRGLDPSYIGRVGLTSSSAGDPGMTLTFTPFMKNYGFYFDDITLD